MKKRNLKSLKLNKEKVSELKVHNLTGGIADSVTPTYCKDMKFCQYISLNIPINYCY